MRGADAVEDETFDSAEFFVGVCNDQSCGGHSPKVYENLPYR